MAAAADVVDLRTGAKLQRFDGADERRGDWRLRFEAYASPSGFEDLAAEGSARREPLPHDRLGERARQVSAWLWRLLITRRDGKAAGVIELSRESGLEARMQLKIERESRAGNRWTAAPRFILNPHGKWAEGREAGVDFFRSLMGGDRGRVR